jgi:PPK2 family polyphosphate:nucleotide phosphotransferase
MNGKSARTLGKWRLDDTRKVRIEDLDPQARPMSVGSKDDDKARTVDLAGRLAVVQDRFYALRERKVLLVLQGMDTSGKDGTVRSVFQAVDPLGVRAVSYKAPTAPEKERDFLWRHHRDVPGLGEIVIFNRSHYEAVLIEWVHGWIDDKERRRRLAHIVRFEDMLAETGTLVIKCFLHISAEAQRARLQDRIDDPDKRWKFNPQDLEERKLWDRYQQAYEKVLRTTATGQAPWYVVPSDSKTHRNLMVLEILLAELEPVARHFPPGDPKVAGTVVV